MNAGIALLLAVHVGAMGFVVPGGANGDSGSGLGRLDRTRSGAPAKTVAHIEPSYVVGIFEMSSGRLDAAMGKLVSMRYFARLDAAVLGLLRQAWFGTDLPEKWNKRLIMNARFRVLLAEVLFRHDPDQVQWPTYRGYVRVSVGLEDPLVREVAALSLGFVGTTEDINTLINILENDVDFVAVQAGFGLVAMGRSEATRALKASLSSLANSEIASKRDVAERVETMLSLVR